GEEIVNAHLSLALEIIPIVHRNYDGWTIRWSLSARRPTRDHEFESDFLQQRVSNEPGAAVRADVDAGGAARLSTSAQSTTGVANCCARGVRFTLSKTPTGGM